MKTAIYKNGIKIAGDNSLPQKLEDRIISAELPVFENGCLYSRESDDSISLICDTSGILGLFEKNSQRTTRQEFLKKLLFTDFGADAKELCKKYSFAFEKPRRLIVAELENDISEYVPVLQDAIDDEETVVLALDSHRIAVIFEEEENGFEQISAAVSATFTELAIDHNIGISGVADSAKELSCAFEQALLALRTGKKLSFSGGIWLYSRVLPELVLSSVSSEKISEIKVRSEKVISAIDADTIELAEEFFRHNLNISETARYCYLHRNTLIYRLDKIQKDTGLNLRNFDDAVAFRIYVATSKVLK